jgi:hypothetical protein
MSKPMPLRDFRAVRITLEPADFAGGEGEPDPPPSDPVAPDTWLGITGLADDVAIRTSDHNGKALGEVYALRPLWLAAIGYVPDALSDPMLDTGADLQSSMFNALHGYYRAGFSALRSIVELMAVGAAGTFVQNGQLYADWRAGTTEFSFGHACDLLSTEPRLLTFNHELRKFGQALFDAKDKTRGLAGGRARQWYGELCNYAHSRPGFADTDLWRSNGPIYVPEIFSAWHRACLHTFSLCAVLVLLARPQADRPQIVPLFTDRVDIVPTDLGQAFALALGHRQR